MPMLMTTRSFLSTEDVSVLLLLSMPLLGTAKIQLLYAVSSSLIGLQIDRCEDTGSARPICTAAEFYRCTFLGGLLT
jgi:hypothetical protein